MQYLSRRSILIFICPLSTCLFLNISFLLLCQKWIHPSLSHKTHPFPDILLKSTEFSSVHKNCQICIIFWMSHTILSIMTGRNWKQGVSWVSGGEGRQSETGDSFILLYFIWRRDKRWRNQFQKGCSSFIFVCLFFCMCYCKSSCVYIRRVRLFKYWCWHIVLIESHLPNLFEIETHSTVQLP